MGTFTRNKNESNRSVDKETKKEHSRSLVPKIYDFR